MWTFFANTFFSCYFSEEDEFDYKEMLTRDRRRWKMADVDKDNKVTKEEYTAFLHPEEYDHMKDVVIDETLEDIDKDGDGFVSIDEYLGMLYNGKCYCDFAFASYYKIKQHWLFFVVLKLSALFLFLQVCDHWWSKHKIVLKGQYSSGKLQSHKKSGCWKMYCTVLSAKSFSRSVF